MPGRQSKPTGTYSVIVNGYASAEIKVRVERGEEFITDPAQLTGESYYLGTSEARAGAAFYRATKQAMKDPLAFRVTVYRDGTIVAQVNLARSRD